MNEWLAGPIGPETLSWLGIGKDPDMVHGALYGFGGHQARHIHYDRGAGGRDVQDI